MDDYLLNDDLEQFGLKNYVHRYFQGMQSHYFHEAHEEMIQEFEKMNLKNGTPEFEEAQ